MRTFFSTLVCLTLISNASMAQDIISKVPANANVVVKYSGPKLLQKLPSNKFDSYKYIKKNIFKELEIDKKTSITNIGIDLEQNAYQYTIASDTADFLVTLFNIKDEAKFKSFLQKNYKPATPFDNKKGYKFYAVSKNAFLGWDGKLATLVTANYTSYDYYYAPTPAVDSTRMYEGIGKTEPYTDSTISLEEATPAMDTVAKLAADSAAAAVAVQAAVEEVKQAVEEVKVDTAISEEAVSVDGIRFTPPVEYTETEEQKTERLAREKFYKDLEIHNDSVRQALSENIIFNIYNTPTSSIETTGSFNKLIDNNADISVWVDSTGFFNKLWRKFYYPYSRYNAATINTWPGSISGINIFFEKDKVRMAQTLYSSNEKTNNLLKETFNSKQSASLVNYFHPGDLGYFSSSMNTEALVNYYYTVIKAIYSNMTYTKKYAPAIDAYVDLLEIMIDEKAISDMITGNAMFILHKVKPKTVKYITYDYDKNFGSKEVEKTKIETSPDFTVVFETRNEKIFDKMANLPIKLKETDTTNDYNYAKTGDYYTLTLGEKDLLDKLYFKIKDGKCIITTLLQNVADPSYNKALSIDAATAASITNNNGSLKLNIKDILKDCAITVSDKKNKKILNYLQENAGTLTLESGLKDNTIQSNTILTIKGNHKNSLEYFFNLMETILQIEESNK